MHHCGLPVSLSLTKSVSLFLSAELHKKNCALHFPRGWHRWSLCLTDTVLLQVMLDAELGAAAGSHGGQVDVMAANVTCPRESFHSFSYSRVSRGLMVDVSWNGGRPHLRCYDRRCHDHWHLICRLWCKAASHKSTPALCSCAMRGPVEFGHTQALEA